MNLQQLEYLLALEREQQFVKAAEACHVSQPTLSMMLQKLEEELGLQLIDRSKQPIQLSEEGKAVAKQARLILQESKQLKHYAAELRGAISGELRIAVIPTLAPYLLPLFLPNFLRQYPQVQVFVQELFTNECIQKLKSREVDIALLSSPLLDNAIKEELLYEEPFWAYVHSSKQYPSGKKVKAQALSGENLWLLEEGHCFRNQVLSFCSLQSKEQNKALHYQAGSFESLVNLVDNYQGLTVLPHFASMRLNNQQRKKLREFDEPKPSREIALAYLEHYPRKKLLEVVKSSIKLAVNSYLSSSY